MILDLLQGKNKHAQQQLLLLKNSIPEDPNVLWYPSAGNDYRDLLELFPERAKRNNIHDLPDIYVHTDYNPNFLKFFDTVYCDNNTSIKIIDRYELKLTTEIKYHVNPRYTVHTDSANKQPVIWLLKVEITSDIYGTYTRTVIYFLFENINFLEEVILKNMIRISHIVKVREGCSYGGNKKSITFSYLFLDLLGTKYLICDDKLDIDESLAFLIASRYGLVMKSFMLTKIGKIPNWSSLPVSIHILN